LGDKKRITWKPSSEIEKELFPHFSEFILQKSKTSDGEEVLQFGNLTLGRDLVNSLSPHANEPKKYSKILQVLQNKA
jgi:hypothetical protein